MYGHLPTADDLPIDVEMAASFFGAKVRYSSGGPAGSVRHEAGRYLITVNGQHSHGRVRFSVAHEVMHIPFMSATGATGRTDETEHVDWSNQEELLCEIGAAELLMPATAVGSLISLRPTMDDVHAVARHCGTSLEASLRRTVELSGLSGSAVVLERRLKPTEIRALEQAKSSLVASGPRAVRPAPQLRVAYAINYGFYIPKHKSIAASCPLAAIETSGRVDFVGDSGLVMPGRNVAVSAEHAPLRHGPSLGSRVLALVFDATEWRSAVA
ncbi:MAG: ImmA/IrrE family metallo-endopeptidase [Actinomycetota bacterium]